MIEIVKKLEKELVEIDKRRKDVSDAISSLQKICPHKYEQGKDTLEYEGNDSHNTFYKCYKCNKKIK